jgi:hypothetical protein
MGVCKGVGVGAHSESILVVGWCGAVPEEPSTSCGRNGRDMRNPRRGEVRVRLELGHGWRSKCCGAVG